MKSYAAYRETFAQNLSSYAVLGEQLSRLYHYDSLLDQSMQDNEISENVYDELIKQGRENTAVLTRDADIRKKCLDIKTFIRMMRV